MYLRQRPIAKFERQGDLANVVVAVAPLRIAWSAPADTTIRIVAKLGLLERYLSASLAPDSTEFVFYGNESSQFWIRY